METSFEGVQSDVNLAVLEEVRGVEDAVAAWADALSDQDQALTFTLLNCEVPAWTKI